MIISHKHKFIFIHCRKTAGSSITVSLARDLGPNDLILGSMEDMRLVGVKPPWCAIKDALKHPDPKAAYQYLPFLQFSKFIAKSNRKYYSNILGSLPAHASATEIMTAFPKEWNDYSKFCVVRNPWTKTISDYNWRTKKLQNPPTFSDYVHALKTRPGSTSYISSRHDNWPLYTIENNIAVDHVIRFEDLHSELAKYFSSVRYEWDGWLPRSKSGTNKTVMARYSNETREIVGDLYEREISFFDYKFPLELGLD